ncbi:protein FAM131C [Astyanax mexicanus]|uniref:protein FAM131C n=1 Tax=Astyanax mexicanus TaxID=7994 RepID=UPI0020CB3D58|nr:protein FAM131C [Astyanax mexicanus]
MVTMGACLCKGHQDLQNDQQHPMGELKYWSEGEPIAKGNHQPHNGSVTDKKDGSGYSIGELATSSLMGLVATIKEHITKPTAMAQGRVAHLIEWKGWGGETTAGGGWCGWTRDGGGWGGAGATLQEDEQLYSHLTDEIKEARFAAGVAEQFALAEASMEVWPSQDIVDQATVSTGPLQGADGLYLSQFLVDGGSLGVPQHLYSIHLDPNAVERANPLAPAQPPQPYFPQPESQHPLQEQRTLAPDGNVRHADSGSISEDEVFYD